MSCPQEMASPARTPPPASSTAPAKQPNSHRVRGLPSRASRREKARPRATERGNTDE